jgi:hypothetical protein
MDKYDFHQFWKWKLNVESNKESILAPNYINETFRRLRRALPKWRTYRPFKSTECLNTLRISLERISEAYLEIRNVDLLGLRRAPLEQLRLIWHELGRAKEQAGRANTQGRYYIVAVSKPLLFLWGQTLAFDSIVRANIPRFGLCSSLINDTRWDFETWIGIMENLASLLRNKPCAIDAFKKEAEKKYGRDSIVPYGRFLDIYYYQE